MPDDIWSAPFSDCYYIGWETGHTLPKGRYGHYESHQHSSFRKRQPSGKIIFPEAPFSTAFDPMNSNMTFTLATEDNFDYFLEAIDIQERFFGLCREYDSS